MKKDSDSWVAWTFFLAAAFVLSNCLWFYNWQVRKVAHREQLEFAALTSASTPAPAAPIAVVDDVELERRDNLRQMQLRAVEESQELLPGEKCVMGRRFARIDGELRDVPGRCR